MAGQKNKSAVLRQRRHWRARERHNLQGSAERPRLNVFRSTKHIFAQVIDDSKGHTLAAASTLDKDILGQAKELSKVERSKTRRQVDCRTRASGRNQKSGF